MDAPTWMVVGLLLAGLNATGLETLILAYVGPDQILPLTSVIGSIVGVLLIFWNRVVSLAARVWHLVTRR